MNCLTPYVLPGSSNVAVPCGKCVACCMNYSKEWSLRMYHEFLACDKVGMMLTLTYAKTDGDLHRDDLQRFFKRLRKHIYPQRIRYFYCGEYGGKGSAETPNGRPHYHAVVFGWTPDDLKAVFDSSNVSWFQSKTIEKIWSLGFVSVGKVTIDSVKYCAKYLCKLDPREHNVKPFTGMSLKPGLGADYVDNIDLVTGKIYVNGRSYNIPKYYLKLLERQGKNVDIYKARRNSVAESLSGDLTDKIEEGKRVNQEKLDKLFSFSL